MTFAKDLQQLIDNSYNNTWDLFDQTKNRLGLYKVPKRTTAKWKTPGEPAFVEQLVAYPFVRRRLANIIHRHLSPTISKGKPLVSGVFIHQKPKIKFGKPASQIELGDVLFVRHHFQTGKGTPDGRAFLLQAKSTSTLATGTLSGKEAKQFDLYADWNTDFSFPHGELGAPPSGKKWNFSKGPAPFQQSGFYGLVSKDRAYVANKFPSASPWAVGAAVTPGAGGTKQVHGTTSLSQALVSFLQGTHGRPWYVGAGANDHWSHFVEEILKSSMDFPAWKTRVSRIGRIDIPRHHHALAYVSSFALQEAFHDLSIAMQVQGDQFQFSKDKFEGTGDFIGEQARDWITSAMHAGDDTLPPEDTAQRDPSGGGMSVIYIATFGDESLAEPRNGNQLEG